MATHEKYLILGSNSFSGATLADHLAAEGHDVLAASRSEEAHPAFLPYKWQARPGKVRFKRIDHNHDLCALKALLARRAADACREFCRAKHGRRELAES